MPLTATSHNERDRRLLAAAQAVVNDGLTTLHDAITPQLHQALLQQLQAWPEEAWNGTGPGAHEISDALLLPAALELLNTPSLVAVVDALFEGQARLLSATGRRLDPQATAQRLHRDYPKHWPVRRPARSLWSVYPCLIAAFYPAGLRPEAGPLMVAYGTQSDRVGDASVPAVAVVPNAADVVVFDAAVLHGSGENSSADSRYALFLDFAPAYVRRPRPLARCKGHLSDTQVRLLGDWFVR